MKKFFIEILDFLGIKKSIKFFLLKSRSFFVLAWLYIFNSEVRRQQKNFKSIPIIIISFNQVGYLRQLIAFLKKHDYSNIVILDNNSTYKPLLDYFETIESSVTLHRLNENLGHLVFWKKKELFDKYSKGYYVVTDPDVVPDVNCPNDFLLHFKKILDINYQVTKVGFSLRIDDIPNTNINKDKIINWESRFWKKRTFDNNYRAGIDTTFALYRPKYCYDNDLFLKGCRTIFPYTAKHGGWYVDTNNLTDEQRFYYENCNDSSSWRVDSGGNLLKGEYS